MMRRILVTFLSIAMMAAFALPAYATDGDWGGGETPYVPDSPPDGEAHAGDVVLATSEIATDGPNGQVDMKLYLLYKGSNSFPDNLEMFEISPVPGDLDKFPFEITWSSYINDLSDIKRGDPTPFRAGDGGLGENHRYYFPFTFTVKADTYNGYYPIQFKVRYLHKGQNLKFDPPVEEMLTVYVHIKHGKVVPTPTPEPTEKPEVIATPKPQARVILQRYVMEPSEVVGGDYFDLTLVLENTNKDMAVTNMKCSIAEEKGKVLPESGSSSFFVGTIGAQETAQITLPMQALPDAGIEPVKITLTMEYDDKNDKNVESEVFTLPIHQVIKLDNDEPNMPSDAYVDEPFNLMMRFYNTGKATMYNTRVFLESETLIADETLFAGTVEPGGQGYYDVMVTAPSHLLPSAQIGEDMDPSTLLPGGDAQDQIAPESDEPAEYGDSPEEEVIDEGAVGATFAGYYSAMAISVASGGMMAGDGGGGISTLVCEGNIVITYEDNMGAQYRKDIPIIVNIHSFDQAYQSGDEYWKYDYDPDTGLLIDRETGLYYDPMTMELVERGTNPFLYIGIAAAAVVVIIVAILLIVKARKKKRLLKEQRLEMELEAEQHEEGNS